MNISKLHAALVTLMLALPSLLPGGTPLLEYLFEETGTTATNTGSLGSSANLTFYNSSGAATDLHSAAGSGVGGQGIAFDNTASTGSGSAGTGGRAETADASVSTNLGALKSFTIAGWFKVDTTTTFGGGQTRLLTVFTEPPAAETAAGISLYGSDAGRLTLRVNGTGFTSATAKPYYNTSSLDGQWVFFAVTYDGNQSSNNVKFYLGTETIKLTDAHTTGSIAAGSVVSSGTALTLGNNIGGSGRPFDALFDDIRLYGSTTDNSGVLSLGELETLRAGAIPEPSTVALLASSLLFVVAMAIRQRTRR
ncbi:LamG domain-containing protein [Opitutaceae bacterium TAV4]|nr:LamG domain-containing protein [Opitutaceae bacterium TAV4]RRK02641.1 LamG domain-containing protein [Opitutaceae bacterium TAV3]